MPSDPNATLRRGVVGRGGLPGTQRKRKLRGRIDFVTCGRWGYAHWTKLFLLRASAVQSNERRAEGEASDLGRARGAACLPRRMSLSSCRPLSPSPRSRCLATASTARDVSVAATTAVRRDHRAAADVDQDVVLEALAGRSLARPRWGQPREGEAQTGGGVLGPGGSRRIWMPKEQPEYASRSSANESS